MPTRTSTLMRRYAMLLLFCLLIPLAGLAAEPGDPVLVSLKEHDQHPSKSLKAELAFPGARTFYLHASTSSWVNVGTLSFEIAWPQDAPTNAQVMVHLKDWDYYWYQNILPGYLVPGKDNHFTVSLSPSSEAWQPGGHHGTWHLRALMDPKQFGIRVFHKGAYSGSCAISNVTTRPRKDSGKPFIQNVRPTATRIPRFGKFELTFDIPDRYPDPFDAKQIAVVAGFLSPSGKCVTVEGYYGRDYFRVVDTAGEYTRPQGRPYWRIRFSPSEQGEYTYSIKVNDRFGETEWGPATFKVGPSESPGFIRVSKKDSRYFEHDSGADFFPIGHNTRSPFDNRADKQFPWKQRFPEGTAAYVRYFKDMGQHGENLAEIWASAWSLGLEWASRRPGYHGIGQYNMKNAWEMDRTLSAAEASGIYLNYVVHNHGKFGTFYDHEWELNPFNVKCGGYLKKPEEYFTDPRALEAFRKLMRYTIARWGYSTHIFAWELWSELNLTGSNKKETNYRRPEVVEWHRTMGQMIKRIDPYDHLIGTHISGDYTKQNKALLELTEMDFCPVDAYHFSPDPVHIVELMRKTAVFNNPFNKPVLITEFGGSHMAAGVKHLDDTLHAALWASVCTPLAGTPLFWWWQIIEEEDFYPHYRAIRNFMKGEDRRDPEMKMAQLQVVKNGGVYDLKGTCLKNQHRGLGWIYRRREFEFVDPSGKATVTNASIRVTGITNEVSTVEFWNTLSGKPIATNTVPLKSGSITVPVPPFARDIAFKIKPGENDE